MGTDYDVTPWHYIIAFGSTVLMAYFVYWYINKGHEASDAWNNEHNQLKEALQQEDQELQKNNYEGVTFAYVLCVFCVCAVWISRDGQTDGVRSRHASRC